MLLRQRQQAPSQISPLLAHRSRPRASTSDTVVVSLPPSQWGKLAGGLACANYGPKKDELRIKLQLLRLSRNFSFTPALDTSRLPNQL